LASLAATTFLVTAAAGLADEVTGEPCVAAARAFQSIGELALQEAMAPPIASEVAVPPPVAPAPAIMPPAPRLASMLSVEPLALLLPSPPPASSFLASADTGDSPPDSHGAVGRRHLIVAVNGRIRILDRSGNEIRAVSLRGFWSALGARDVFDPQSLYDPFDDRWIITTAADRYSDASSLLVGVSQSADPTGFWNLYRMDAGPPAVGSVDRPQVGFSRDWIAVQVSLDRFRFGATIRPLFVFDKADLYSAGAGRHTRFCMTGLTPAVTLDRDASLFLAGKSVHFALWGMRRAFFKIVGRVGAERVVAAGVTPLTPIEFTQLGDFAPQLGSPERIETGDGRVMNLVYRNQTLWGAETVYLPSSGRPTRTAVRWWQIGSTGGAFLQEGLIDDPAGRQFFAYPTIAVNERNDALIGYSRFSAAQYPSANYAIRRADDPPGTMRADTVLKEGEGPYFRPDSVRGNRWGDYSNTVVDPLNDTDLWTIQEYAAADNRWGTWWGRLSPRCGDGISDPGEECDDQNVTEGDGCAPGCRRECSTSRGCDDGDPCTLDTCAGRRCVSRRCGPGAAGCRLREAVSVLVGLADCAHAPEALRQLLANRLGRAAEELSIARPRPASIRRTLARVDRRLARIRRSLRSRRLRLAPSCAQALRSALRALRSETRDLALGRGACRGEPGRHPLSFSPSFVFRRRLPLRDLNAPGQGTPYTRGDAAPPGHD
jgi:cysteine-rich repeat protein